MASVKTSPGQHKNREIKQELQLIIIIITQKATVEELALQSMV